MSAATFVRDLTAFSIQIALIVLAVAVLLKAVHIPARARYNGLRLALIASLLVPWLLRAEVPVEPAPTVAQPAPNVVQTPAGAMAVTPSPRAATAAAEPRLEISWLPVLLGVLGLGVVGRGLWLAVGLVRLRRLTKTGTVVEEPEYVELQEQVGARATIAQVMGLAQPATFGVRRPVVMLPDSLTAAPASLRRAVIIHELFHVRRRDWLFVLAEEMVRTVLWFHPAILWLTSHIQLAREEIVDELTVRATGDRRTYVQALLTFADSGSLSPAPAFARRRQLFHRILSVSKEKVMSRPRVVISTMVLVAVVSGVSWYASSLFPIVKAGSVAFTPASLLGGQDVTGFAAPVLLMADEPVQRPAPAQGVVALLDQRTVEVVTPKQVTPENPIPRRTRGVTPAWPAQFAGRQFHVLVHTLVTLDRGGAVIAVDRGGCQIVERPAVGERNDPVCSAFFDASANAIRQWRYERPVQSPLQFTVLSTFIPGSEPTVTQAGSDVQRYLRETPESLRAIEERQRLADGSGEFLRQQLADVTNKLRELERAYRIESERNQPGSSDLDNVRRQLASMNDMMVLLQRRLSTPQDASSQEELAVARRQLEQAQAQIQAQLRETERQLAQSSRQPEPAVSADVRPTPTTPFDGSPQLRSPSGRAPIRVTPGVVAPPRVLKSVNAQYSAEAMRERLQGTVRVEALVDEQGRVADARVLTSLPLLDESALAAARQWEFTPTLLNGQPVPVLVMLEMHFTLK